MFPRLTSLSRLLAVVPVLLLVTFTNVFICFASSAVVLMQLLTNGTNRYVALFVAVLVAIGVHFYLVFNHKIRNYITKQGTVDDEQ